MSATIWLTGLPCAGKSTLAAALQGDLAVRSRAMRVLDGDDLRRGLCRDLGFSDADRSENIRRVGEVAALFNAVGVPVVVALVSPRISDRQRARGLIGPARFREVYLSTPLAVCEARDVKGMYARARRGELAHFTGVDAPYEPPPAPDLTLDTAGTGVQACVDALRRLLDEAEAGLR
jgi:adenylyl-sulfate kinase